MVRDRLLLMAERPDPADAATAGALAALAVGDQAAIAGAGWEVFRDTGVAHLMSISGLHITMLGWLGGAAFGALWRRSERATLAWPATRRGALGRGWRRLALCLAGRLGRAGAAHGGDAGGHRLAAQRGPGVAAGPGHAGRHGAGDAARSVGAAAAGLLAVVRGRGPVDGVDAGALRVAPGPSARDFADLDAAGARVQGDAGRDAPGARARGDASASEVATGLGDAGAGRSVAEGWFGRIGALLGAGATRLGAELRGGVRAQVVASIGLAPLTLVAFQQVSPVGLLANLVAEPWVTLVVTPLTLLGIALPPLWTLAAIALKPLLWWLAWLARWPLASVHVATAPGWALLAGVAGGAVLMLPLPWRVRSLGLALLPPLMWPFVARPALGRFELVAADIGQGTAVLVRTHAHLLLFDTGPRLGDDNDAGRRLLLPLLQARGEPRIDTLLLSHADADHVGGAQSLIDRLPVLALRSSLSPDNPLRANPIPHTACQAGQAWAWDGVRFTMLHPFPDDYRPGAKTNALSCVLRVVDTDGHSALLTGDVEAAGEARMVARARAAPGDTSTVADMGTDAGARLRSDVLIVPHHGSHTSSTEALLGAVRPAVAVIQVGYRSRYGHPAPDVVARYRAHGIPLVRSDHCGAWTWSDGRAWCTPRPATALLAMAGPGRTADPGPGRAPAAAWRTVVEP